MLIIRLLLLLVSLAQVALCAQDFYNVLGVSRKATEKEIKSAYRKLSKKYHPDKNPNDPSAESKFVEVASAYEALIDSESRKIYDRYGHDGLKQRQQQQGSGGQHHDPFDLFSRFFGGGGHFGNHPGQRHGPKVDVRVKIALRDFYNGRNTEFQWDKQMICEDCEGTGSADKHLHTCPHCNGHGHRIIKHQIAPGMYQQVQLKCDPCGGRGQTFRKKCPVCQGQRVVRKSVMIPLKIERGAPRDAHLVYENEADQSPDYVAGDLVVTLVEQDAGAADNPDRVDGAFFRRKGDDLHWTELLSLREAWLGDWTRNLTHLDGHIVRLGRKRGQVVQPGSVEIIEGEGMPVWSEHGDDVFHDTQFGKLHVHYEVVLPDQMGSRMEQDFWAVWQKWRGQLGVDLHADSGRPDKPVMVSQEDEESDTHDEL